MGVEISSAGMNRLSPFLHQTSASGYGYSSGFLGSHFFSVSPSIQTSKLRLCSCSAVASYSSQCAPFPILATHWQATACAELDRPWKQQHVYRARARAKARAI